MYVCNANDETAVTMLISSSPVHSTPFSALMMHAENKACY